MTAKPLTLTSALKPNPNLNPNPNPNPNPNLSSHLIILPVTPSMGVVSVAAVVAAACPVIIHSAAFTTHQPASVS